MRLSTTFQLYSYKPWRYKLFIQNTNIRYKRPHCNTDTLFPCKYLIAIQDTSLQINKHGNLKHFHMQIT